jgi:hypothetical protein
MAAALWVYSRDWDSTQVLVHRQARARAGRVRCSARSPFGACATALPSSEPSAQSIFTVLLAVSLQLALFFLSAAF